MTKIIHPIAGGIAFLTILLFWGATIGVDLFGTRAQVIDVKTAIPYGLLVLIPAMILVRGSGYQIAKGRRGRLVDAKRRRMYVIAANGLLVLVPAVLFLAFKARADELDAAFFAVQAVELTAGTLNLGLLGLSIRDGLRLTGRLNRSPGPG